MSTPREWNPVFSSPFCQSQCSFHQLRGLVSPVQVGPQDQSAQSVALTAHSLGQISTYVFSHFLGDACQGHMPEHYHFSPPSTGVCVHLSYSLVCTGVFLPVSSQFSVRLVPHVDVFSHVHGGTHILIFHHLDGSVPNDVELMFSFGGYHYELKGF